MEPFTGEDLRRMAYQSEGDEELERLWDKCLIFGIANGLGEEDILGMTLEEIFAED